MKAISIPLTNGGFAVVDESDSHLVQGRRWYAVKSRGVRYARTRKNQGMHRLILGVADPSKIVDHINGNGLDNRRANLRIVDVSSNVANRQNSRAGNRCPGVYLASGKWRAKVTVNYVTHELGRYDTEEQAIVAVNLFRQQIGRPLVIATRRSE